MISRQFRFQGRNALDHVYRRGSTVRGDMLSLKFNKSNSSHYRLSVVVSKKVSKSAVVRNRIRRRIYEIVRLTAKSGNLPNNDMIISVYDDRPATMSSAELQKTIEKLLNKSKA